MTTALKCPILIDFMANKPINRANFTPELGASYAVKLQTIIKRFSESNEITEATLDWIKIVEFSILTIAPNNTKSGWRIYKGTLKKMLSFLVEHDAANKEVFVKSLNQLIFVSGKEKTTISSSDATRTKSPKAKRVTPEDIYLLRLFSSSEIDDFTIAWFEFCMLTSTRPNEVSESYLQNIHDVGYILYIKNTVKSEKSAKDLENGRLNEFRSVPLTHLSYLDIVFIQSFLLEYSLRAEGKSYEELYEQARKSLYKVSLAALGKSISLSVARTQYAANAKSTNLSPEVIADRMGHTDPTRPARSYGRKASGFGGIKEVDEVEK